MSGALLETAGQLRDAYPFVVQKALSATLQLVTAAPAVNSVAYSSVQDGRDLPFDYGPDKPGRLFPVICGFGVLITSAVYNAAGLLVGNIFWQDTGGNEVHLLSLADFLPNQIKFNSERIVTPYVPLFAGQVDFIGKLVWRNDSTVISTLSNTVAKVTLNIGYYGDYAEYDFNQLKKCEHHHYHGVTEKPDVDMTPV
jgi:hypothetical protein